MRRTKPGNDLWTVALWLAVAALPAVGLAGHAGPGHHGPGGAEMQVAGDHAIRHTGGTVLRSGHPAARPDPAVQCSDRVHLRACEGCCRSPVALVGRAVPAVFHRLAGDLGSDPGATVAWWEADPDPPRRPRIP